MHRYLGRMYLSDKTTNKGDLEHIQGEHIKPQLRLLSFHIQQIWLQIEQIQAH